MSSSFPGPAESVELFFSYSHQDEELRNELEKHLSLLKREGLISAWHDRTIGPGENFRDEIQKHISSARVILLLISADFLASDYCYDTEIKIALERNQKGEARVIPVILRPADWKTSPFGKLLALPTDGEPITSSKWPSRDEAFLNVAHGIRRAVQELRSPTVRESETTIPIGRNKFFEDVSTILGICKRGVPAEVLAAVFGRSLLDLQRELTKFAGKTFRVEDGNWSLSTGIAEEITATPPNGLLISKTLDELLGFIKNHRRDSGVGDQALNAIELARACQFSYPNTAAKLLWVIDKFVKDFGNKRLVLDVATLSIEAARRSTNRTEEVVKAEAVALICGLSWVLQRTGRLNEALTVAQESLRLGENIPWERNTVFCKKCIGRIYRMQAQEELEKGQPDRAKVLHLLEESALFINEGIIRFGNLEEIGPTHPEVGDCYSLLGRTYLVGGRLSDADEMVKNAFNLIPENSGKDYLDLLILAGDLQARRGQRDTAESFYDSALKIKSDNFEMTEMRGRAYLSRGLNREAMKRPEAAIADIAKAVEIFKELDEVRSSNKARWEQYRIQKQIPQEALPLLKNETYTTRVLALQRYSEIKGQNRGKKKRDVKVVGHRAALSTEQWQQIIKEARARADQEEPKW